MLAHDLGSAREVLSPDNPLIDCNQTDLVVRTVVDWHAGSRPQVDTRPEFRLSRVAGQWAGLLEG